MKPSKIKNLTLAGLFTAIVFITTAYLHIPSHTGYTHIGDTFIYLAASILPLPYAITVGAVGAILADCLTGFAVWAPGSLVIKTLAVLFFTSKKSKILNTRNLLALIPASLLCIGGYYLYEVIITANFISPLIGIPGYIIQSVLSSLLYVIIGLAFDKLDIRSKLL